MACIISKRDIPQDPVSVVMYKSGSVEGMAIDTVAGKESVKSVLLNTQRLFTNRSCNNINTQTTAK